MQYRLTRILSGKSVYLAGLVSCFLSIVAISILYVNFRFSLVALVSLVLAVISLCGSWLAHVFYVRSRLQVVWRETSTARDQLPESLVVEMQQLSTKLGIIETDLSQKFDSHAAQQLNEYKTQAFNNHLNLQDLKVSLLETRGFRDEG